jgi:cyclopropane-fatty-acyl-phospholipid synthase
MLLEQLLARNLLPDALVRWGIRRRLRGVLREQGAPDIETAQARLTDFLSHMDSAPIALNTADSRQQHYEVPAAFFTAVLGPHLKYSSALWEPGTEALAAAERAMLERTCERAELDDGQRVLDLGCGWGSFSLFAAQRYPGSHITAVSHSHSQRAFIERAAAERGLDNLTVVTQDANALNLEGPFDRIVSVEMFEHMRNHRKLLAQLAELLTPGGKLFIHIFTHRELAYLYNAEDPAEWMARHFFTGGMMPSRWLLFHFQDVLRVERHWTVDGRHYERTLNAWLARMDGARESLWPLFERTYGTEQARLWWMRWRVFFMACAELFGYRGGSEWFVSHYRLVRA